MSEFIKINIDGVNCETREGVCIADAARENGIYVPTLCHIPGIKAQGACRICTVKVNGRFMTACTTPAKEGMVIENNVPELNEMRKAIIEVLFVEGNHFCPSCEKSGNCMLQALAYRFQMMVPRYPYQFPVREIEAWHPRIIKDQNRCILCKRCIKSIKDEHGRSYFAFDKRGRQLRVVADAGMAPAMSEEKAREAMDICPVGSILVRDRGFIVPIGQRKYDQFPIGRDIESKIVKETEP